MANSPRVNRSLMFVGFFVLALFAAFAVTYSMGTSKQIERSADQHGSQARSGKATNNPEPTRTDTGR